MRWGNFVKMKVYFYNISSSIMYWFVNKFIFYGNCLTYLLKSSITPTQILIFLSTLRGIRVQYYSIYLTLILYSLNLGYLKFRFNFFNSGLYCCLCYWLLVLKNIIQVFNCTHRDWERHCGIVGFEVVAVDKYSGIFIRSLARFVPWKWYYLYSIITAGPGRPQKSSISNHSTSR